MRSTAVPLLSALLFVLQAIPALAGEGLFEINQTCAVETGCFAGDAAGFPVTIAASGTSYLLTSSLVVPNEHTHAISIQTSVSNVSIDLGGLEIRGPVTCSGNPLVCTPALASGVGILGNTSTNRGFSVSNGSITGMTYGVLLGDFGTVSKIRISANRVAGIAVSNGATISDCTLYQNGIYGISTGSGSTISGSLAYQTGAGGAGIGAGSNSTVSDNTTYLNQGVGINCGTGCAISGNSSGNNGDEGISTASGSNVSHNASYNNTGDGIQASNGSTVQGNTVRSNDGLGLNLGTQSGYRENVISANTGGTVNAVAGLVNLGGNACDGSLTCP